MDALGPNQAVVELGLESVQELPREGVVGAWVGPGAGEASRLLRGQDIEIGDRVARAQRQARSPTSAQFLSVSHTRTVRSDPAGSSERIRSQNATARFSAVGMIPSSQGTSLFRLR